MKFTLIQTNVNGVFINTVNARDIHKELKSKQDFSTWIKNRIKQGGFVENEDFISLHKTVEREIGATSKIEYHVTFDMAKHLGMMERNKQGKKVRQYFIDQDKAITHVAKLLLAAQKAMKEYTKQASKWGEDGNLLKMKKPLMIDALSSAENLAQLTLSLDDKESKL